MPMWMPRSGEANERGDGKQADSLPGLSAGRLDLGDMALQFPPGEGIAGDSDGGAYTQPSHVRLVHVHPDAGRFGGGDLQERIALEYPHPRPQHLRALLAARHRRSARASDEVYRAADRREDAQSRRRCVPRLQFLLRRREGEPRGLETLFRNGFRAQVELGLGYRLSTARRAPYLRIAAAALRDGAHPPPSSCLARTSSPATAFALYSSSVSASSRSARVSSVLASSS